MRQTRHYEDYVLREPEADDVINVIAFIPDRDPTYLTLSGYVDLTGDLANRIGDSYKLQQLLMNASTRHKETINVIPSTPAGEIDPQEVERVFTWFSHVTRAVVHSKPARTVRRVQSDIPF